MAWGRGDGLVASWRSAAPDRACRLCAFDGSRSSQVGYPCPSQSTQCPPLAGARADSEPAGSGWSGAAGSGIGGCRGCGGCARVGSPVVAAFIGASFGRPDRLGRGVHSGCPSSASCEGAGRDATHSPTAADHGHRPATTTWPCSASGSRGGLAIPRTGRAAPRVVGPSRNAPSHPGSSDAHGTAEPLAIVRRANPKTDGVPVDQGDRGHGRQVQDGSSEGSHAAQAGRAIGR